jgi:O-methyltransferase
VSRGALSRVLGDVRRRIAPPPAAPDPLTDLSPLDARDRAIIEPAMPHTMTGVPRLQALVDAVRYVEARGVPGAFAECGVWRGGSVLAMIGTLWELGAPERDIHLFDTFTGMTEPTEHDTSPLEPPALDTWREFAGSERRPWADLFEAEGFSEAAVRARLEATGYPPARLHLVAGPVETTLPAAAPERIAVLRLDTDWYESTRVEMEHLFPRLTEGGVLIVDDYGHWEGARRAVDEYLAAHGTTLLLSRIDYTGRIAVKA